MDDLNTKIALKMQEVAVKVWDTISSLLPYGSYTASQVFKYLSENYTCMEWTKKYNEDVEIEVETFKCKVNNCSFFNVLHQFEKMASIPNKNRKKFIRQAKVNQSADVSFVVEITKSMMPLAKVANLNDGTRVTLQRIALDYRKGFVVVSDGHLMSVQKAEYRDVYVKDGASEVPVLMTVSTFKQCQGSTMVSATEKKGFPENYQFMSDDGGYYEEEAVGRYPNWKSVVLRELFRSGRITLPKDGVKQWQKFVKQAEKNADVSHDGKRLVLQTEGNDLILFYQRDGKMQTHTIHLEEEPAPITICFDPRYLLRLDGWNGTMWITDNSRAVIFDMKEQTDFHLLMPKTLPDGIDVQKGINGTKVSFDERHTEYQQTDCKQNCKQTSKQKKELIIHNSELITQIFMAAGRYEGTQPFYTLEEIERGEFKVRGNHDSELVLFLRTAAHYIRQDQDMQAEFCSYCREQMSGKDWRSIVPLEEMALAELFEGFLSSKGIDDIPDVEFEDESEDEKDRNEDETEVPEVVEEAEEVEEIEAEEVIEEVVEVEEATIKPMAIEREIVPTLELETSDGKLVVAGESYFHKLYDEDEGCFRSEAAEAKFNEIDAFIADELITAEELDYAAIAQAVGEFMEEVAAS